MLHLHFSNRHEVLERRLLDALAEEGAGVFEAEQVIVPSAALRRALSLALARERGICAGVEFAFLAQWLWQLIARGVPGVAEAASPFAAPRLAWRCWRVLEEEPELAAAHPRLSSWLAAADDAMRYELAVRLGSLFEQYVTYRPDWLAAWSRGETVDLSGAGAVAEADARWQGELWRRIAPVAAEHPGEAFVRALERDAGLAGRIGLPRAAHVFALPAMPPLYIRLLERLGRHMALHVYVRNPCREYWFEILDRKRLAHLRLRGAAQHAEEGQRLLAAWGQQTRSHIDLLVEACGEGTTDEAEFVPHATGPGSLLARLQDSVLDLAPLEPGSIALDAADRSIELHVCHSLTRELEVLHDQLLARFAADPTLAPGDVLVVTPDLEAAAPLVEAVFGTVPAERRIPFAITGRARSQASAPAQALLALLSLCASRWTATELFGLLESPLVARRFFSGTGEDLARALQQVRDWIVEAGIRWGQDAAHRAECGVPANAQHTLEEGLARLFLGHALPSRAREALGSLLPAGDAEGREAGEALGAFAAYARALRDLRANLAQPLPPAEWQRLLAEAIETFLEPGSGDALDELRELQADLGALFETLQQAGVERALPLPVLRAALAAQLDDAARGGVAGGSVTFAAMSSLRGLPFRHVCAIGLDDGRYPSPQRTSEFDLMALAPRRGDRQRRHDERNVFLDLLLAARDGFYLSYTGRSIRDNAPLPPSVLVAELLDVLLPAIAGESPSALAAARSRLVVEHPLQAFSFDAFTPEPEARRLGYDRETRQALAASLEARAGPGAHAAAQAVLELAPAAPPAGDAAGAPGGPAASAEAGDAAADEAEPEAEERFAEGPVVPFLDGLLPAPEPAWRSVGLEQFIEFFRGPCRFLLRRRLGLELRPPEEELQDDEPFLPDWRGRTALAERLLPALLEGLPRQAAERLALAGHELPQGALGRVGLERELDRMAAFAGRVREATREACLPPQVVQWSTGIEGEAWQLQGSFPDLRASAGLVRHHYDEPRAKELLRAWLHHLLLAAAPPPGLACAARTEWHFASGPVVFAAPADAPALLAELLGLYRQGLREPLPFFPKTAWDFVDSGERWSAARNRWQPSKTRPWAEGAEAAHRLALRGRDDPLDERFAALARRVYGPLRQHRAVATP